MAFVKKNVALLFFHYNKKDFDELQWKQEPDTVSLVNNNKETSPNMIESTSRLNLLHLKIVRVFCLLIARKRQNNLQHFTWNN